MFLCPSRAALAPIAGMSVGEKRGLLQRTHGTEIHGLSFPTTEVRFLCNPYAHQVRAPSRDLGHRWRASP